MSLAQVAVAVHRLPVARRGIRRLNIHRYGHDGEASVGAVAPVLHAFDRCRVDVGSGKKVAESPVDIDRSDLKPVLEYLGGARIL